MQIAKIDIKNFLGLESLTMALQAPINLVVGENEAGKSSIRDAVLWCLTGQARGLKTHEQQAALIRNDAKAAEVTLTLADGQTLTRRKTPKSPAVVAGSLPDNPLPPAILCDPYEFLALADNQRRELLFRLAPGLSPTAEMIAERLTGVMLKAPDSLCQLAAMDGFAAAEKEAVARRREAKRLRESLGQCLPPPDKLELSGKTYILPDLEAKDITAALIKLQKERDALLQAQGHRQAALENLGKVAAEITQSQANLPEKPPDGEVGKWRAELEEVQPRLAALKDKLGRVWGGQPETFPAACPAIKGQTLSCPRAGETVAPPGQPSQAELNQLQADLAALGEEEQFLLDGLKVALNQEKAHDDAASDLAGLELRLARLQADAAQELPADLDAQLTRLENRLEIGRTLLAAVREWHIKADQAAQYQEMMARAAEEIDLYDALAKAFAPNGLPSQLLAEALGPVNDLLDQASVHLFPGRSLGLTAELDIELSGCPFITLSKSARFRVGLAFQNALARLAGARLLLIDEADVLDPSNRAGLFDFLLEVREHFDTILVGATASEAKPSPVPEIQVWWLENGHITALAPARAA